MGIRLLLFGVAGAAAAAAWAGINAGRSLYEGWGKDPVEAARTLPGDDLIAEPDASDTRVIDIEAPPDRVWPWLVQMGYGRAGWYSYDALDNKQPSATTIEDAWQSLAVGDIMPTHPGGGFEVKVVEPGHALVLYLDRALVEGQARAAKAADEGASTGLDEASPNVRATGAALEHTMTGDFSASWAFVVEPHGTGGTRLIERFRVRMEAPEKAAGLARIGKPLLGFGVFVMVRKQMLGIQARAEGRAEPAQHRFGPLRAHPSPA
jgi:hypothetical protein